MPAAKINKRLCAEIIFPEGGVDTVGANAAFFRFRQNVLYDCNFVKYCDCVS